MSYELFYLHVHALLLLLRAGFRCVIYADRVCRTLNLLQAQQRQTLSFASPATCTDSCNHISRPLLTLTSDFLDDFAVTHYALSVDSVSADDAVSHSYLPESNKNCYQLRWDKADLIYYYN